MGYELRVFRSREDRGWIAAVPELPGCSAFGRTPAEAVREAQTAAELWMEAARKEERKVPEPRALKNLSGRFLLRLPKRLHEELAFEAAEQGVSVNQFMLYILARYRRLGSEAASRIVP